jgi:UDP-2-acetamido-2-deoxy-ribo-hexuluronate aminotransferase
VAPGNTHVYAQYTIRIAERDKVAERLKGKGIPTSVYYPKCLHEQPVFAKLGCNWGDFPESEKASREVLSLPMHPFLTENDQGNIVNAIKN